MEMEDEEKQVRDELSTSSGLLFIAKACRLMFQNIDSFVTLSRNNTEIIEVELYPFDIHSDAGNYEFWDKVGQVIGNLTRLHTLNINFLPFTDDDDDDDDGDEVRTPDWEVVTRILPCLRRKVELSSSTSDDDIEVEEIQGLARAIHGHPMISGFFAQFGFTFASMGTWCSTLATLPSLEDLVLGLQEPET
jgi:hypothetical protein